MRTKSTWGIVLLTSVALAACGDSGGGDGASGVGGVVSGAGGTGASGAGAAGGTGGTTGATGGAGGTDTSTAGAGGMIAGAGGSAGVSGGGAGGTGATLTSYEEAKNAIETYAAAHPGADGDVVAKTPAQLAADPDAQALRDLCGADQAPVIPQLAWEYGGADHAWIGYASSALVYCVYTPVSPSTEHWMYDTLADHVTADVYVLFPDDNPCKDEVGAAQVSACIGDMTNFEILVDTASLDDGHGAGLELSEASTDLFLVLPDDSKVMLYHGT